MGALVLLCGGRWATSALLLSLAVCTKPIGWPILLVALAFLVTRAPRRAVAYAAVVAAASAVLLVAPFVLLRWDATPILRHPNAHFLMSGAMSYMTVVRLWREPLVLPGHWWLLSLLWIPAVAVVAVLVLRHGVAGLGDLAAKSAALVLVFMLTRTWVAEPNAVLLVPLVLVPVALGRLDRRLFTAVWAVPLAFAVFDLAPLQLLWAAFPGAMARALRAAGRYRDVTLAVRAALVVAWQVLGWWLVVACGRRPGAERRGDGEHERHRHAGRRPLAGPARGGRRRGAGRRGGRGRAGEPGPGPARRPAARLPDGPPAERAAAVRRRARPGRGGRGVRRAGAQARRAGGLRRRRGRAT